MKKLFIVRHAKSGWDDASMADHARPLNERGMRDAPRMAEHVCKHYAHPQLLVSSTAVRARSTAEYFAGTFQLPASAVQATEQIYEADVQTLLDVITNLDNEVEAVMLVGHNPGVTSLVSYLIPKHFSHMPTCAIAILWFRDAVSWQEIGRGTGELEAFLYPNGVVEQ